MTEEEIRTVRFMFFLQFLVYYLILLDLQLINFPRVCTVSQEVPSRFPHFLQPCRSGLIILTRKQYFVKFFSPTSTNNTTPVQL